MTIINVEITKRPNLLKSDRSFFYVFNVPVTTTIFNESDEMDIRDFSGKKVLIMGLGKFGGGLDAAVFAQKAGAKVLITDLSEQSKLQNSIEQLSSLDNIEYRLGKHLDSDFAEADIIVVNPAVPPNNKFVKIAEDAGGMVTSQIEIFFQLCKAPIVGVTGANGKSTTTSLTHHLLSAGNKKVWLGGNIGNQPMLSIIEQISEDDIVVLEISSFQCEQLARIKAAPHVSLITNITPNHLDRHGTFEEYCKAKRWLFEYQVPPCVSIFNAEDEVTSGWYDEYTAQQGRKCYKYSPDDVADKYKAVFKLAGKMNLENLAAALRAAEQFGIEEEKLIEAVASFKALPDRLELVAEINGVKWYNDSISTTPTSTVAALKAFEEPKIIIAGGYDKKLPFEEMAEVIAESAKAAVLIGVTAKKIADCITQAQKNDSGCKAVLADSMEQAVQECAMIAEAGDVILMSPACASYDMFENYKQRGRIFTEQVRKLA